MGAEYATLDSAYKVDADPHIGGTITRAGGKTEFWLTIPRPSHISLDEWEKLQQEKWEKIFGKRSSEQ